MSRSQALSCGPLLHFGGLDFEGYCIFCLFFFLLPFFLSFASFFAIALNQALVPECRVAGHQNF